MGTSGSKEQRQCIKALIELNSFKDDDSIEKTLASFCHHFPMKISHETDQEKQAKPRPSPGVTDKKVFHVIYSLLFKYAENQDQIAQHETLVLKLLQSFTRILRWKELYKLVPKYPICPIITCMVSSSLTVTEQCLESLQCLLHISTSGVNHKSVGKLEAMNQYHFAKNDGFEYLSSLLLKYSAFQREDDKVVHILASCLKILNHVLIKRKIVSKDRSAIPMVFQLVLGKIDCIFLLCRHRDTTIQYHALSLIKRSFNMSNYDQVLALQVRARESGAILSILLLALLEAREEKRAMATKGPLFRQVMECLCAGNLETRHFMARIMPCEKLLHHYSLLEVARFSPFVTTTANESDSHLPRRQRSSATTKSSNTASSDFIFHQWLEEMRMINDWDWQSVILSTVETYESPVLIWGSIQLDELIQTLEAAIGGLDQQFDHLDGSEKECHQEKRVVTQQRDVWRPDLFQVRYASLDQELSVEKYYIRCLLYYLQQQHQHDEIASDSFIASTRENPGSNHEKSQSNPPSSNTFDIAEPLAFSYNLFDALTVETNSDHVMLLLSTLRYLFSTSMSSSQGHVPLRYMVKLLKKISLSSPSSFGIAQECCKFILAAMSTGRRHEIILQFAEMNGLHLICQILLRVTIIHQQRSSQQESSVPVKDHANNLWQISLHCLKIVEWMCLEIPVLLKGLKNMKIENGAMDFVDLTELITRLILFSSGVKDQYLLRSMQQNLDQLLQVITILLDGFSVPNMTNIVEENSKSSSILIHLLFITSHPEAQFPLSSSISNILFQFYEQNSNLLSSLLPEYMVRLVEHRLLNEFTSIFNSTQEYQSADVYWNQSMRLYLHDQLEHRLIVNAATSNTMEAIQYDSFLSHHLITANVFMDHYVHSSALSSCSDFLVHSLESHPNLLCSFLQEFIHYYDMTHHYHSHDHNETKKKAMKANHLDPIECQLLLFQGCLTYFQKYPNAEFPSSLLPQLCSRFQYQLEYHASTSTDQIILTYFIQILVEIFSKQQNMDSNLKCFEYFLSDEGRLFLLYALQQTTEVSYLQELDKQTKAMMDDIPENHSTASSIEEHEKIEMFWAIELLVHLIQFMKLLVFFSDSKQSSAFPLRVSISPRATNIQQHLSLIEPLLFHCMKDRIAQNPIIATKALTTIHSCMLKNDNGSDAHSDARLSIFVSEFILSGGVVLFFENCCTFPLKEEEVEHIEILICSILQKCSWFDDQVDSLVDGSPPHQLTAATVVEIFEQLLTPSLLSLLRKDLKHFMFIFHHHLVIEEPTLIWTQTMRDIFIQVIAQERETIKAAKCRYVWPRWNPEHFLAADSFRYQYPELEHEIILNNVYLRQLVELNGQHPPTMIENVTSFAQILWAKMQHDQDHDMMNDSDNIMKRTLEILSRAHPELNLALSTSSSSTRVCKNLNANPSLTQQLEQENESRPQNYYDSSPLDC